MYALVANGIQTICRTQRQLDTMLAIYQYPKFAKCSTEEEALAWIRRHSRHVSAMCSRHYGDTSSKGYAVLRYAIKDNAVYAVLETNLLGYIRVESQSDDVRVSCSRDVIYINVIGVVLDDGMIAHHIIAIRRLLRIIGEYVDVDIVVPDMSVYLAATKYKGKNYIIKVMQKDIMSRLGGVSFTVERGGLSVTDGG